MKNRYKVKNKKLIFNFLLGIGIIMATYCLSIGYAAMEALTLDIDGSANASAQEGIFIANATYDSNVDADKIFSNINSYIQTTLNSSIFLSDTNEKSSITYELTIYNNSDNGYYFVGTDYVEKFYDNLGITYELSGLDKYDLLMANDDITFNITFKYKDNVVAESNELNSCINFLFEPSQYNAIAEFIYDGKSTKKMVSLDDGVTTFDASNVEGTVIRSNNGAVASLENDTITITDITTNMKCEIFDTLEEAVETSDTSVNHMLMIADETVTFEDTNNIKVEANKKINLDINGKQITANTTDRTVTYLDNYGILNIKDSNGSGIILSNYRAIGNLENGELTIESGTYERTEADVYCGGTITNFGGKVILKNSTINAESTAAFLNWGTEESVSLIDNCTLYTNTGDALINGSYDSEISVSNSTITSSSGAAMKGAYLLSGGSDEVCGPIYLCNCELSGIFDYYVPGLGRLYYATNVTFMNGDNTPYSNNSDSLIKNYIATTDNEWYKIKSKNSNGQKEDARYSNGKIIRIGDKINISSLLSSNYLLEVAGSYTNNQNIQIYTRSYGEAQKFMLLASSVGGYYSILVSSEPTMAFNVGDENNIELYTYGDVESERFELITDNIANGSYHINSSYNTYIDVEGKTAANSQNVAVYAPDGTDAQKWKIEKSN